MELLFTLSGHPGGGLAPGEVCVDFSKAHDRLPHAPSESCIDAQWSVKLAANPRLHDGDKFRLGAIEWRGARQLFLGLGLTGYREYIGTHAREPDADAALRFAGCQSQGGSRNSHFSRALGCEAVLSTSDAHVILVRRSNEVSLFQGFYNGPSGHPEPGRMPSALKTHREPLDGPLSVAEAAADRRCRLGDNDAAAVVKELFESVVNETVEEIGIPRDTLGSPLLIGAMQDQSGKPDLLFSLTTALSSAEVKDIYAKGAHAESWESDFLLALPWEEAVSLLGNAGDLSDRIRLTPVTQAALECERTRRQSE